MQSIQTNCDNVDADLKAKFNVNIPKSLTNFFDNVLTTQRYILAMY